GSRPHRSRYARRANSPSAMSSGSVDTRLDRFEATYRSIGDDHAVQVTAGTAGRVSPSGASHGGGAGGDMGVWRAPSSIHLRISAISEEVSGSSSFGICGSILPRTRCTRRLRALSPGLIAG